MKTLKMKQTILNSIFFCFLICFFTPNTQAQFGFAYNDSILVKKGADTLQFPWAGGLNHVQFSSIDVDFDGLEDLFIFDRSENQVIVFKTIEIGGVKSYEYMHDVRHLFPEDMRYRVAMVDYNGDGKKDIFTYGIGGVKVYKNIGNASDGLQWEVAADRLESIYTNPNPTIVPNLYVSSVDIPAYVDIDGDGDIDVLTFNMGGQRVEYHKNLSMENYGVPDSLEFKLYNECWGKFIESDTDNTIHLDSSDGPCGNSNLPDPQRNFRHSGSTLLAIDLDGNDVMDLILGDVDSHNLTALLNGGTQPNQNSIMVNQDPNFPSNTTPVDISFFPASFYLDVDHDGVKDLIVGTNMAGSTDNLESVWYYKNLGANNNPNFSFVKKNFLQGDMIDNGKGAIPVLVDLNNDGLKDLLVGSHFRYVDPSSKASKIQYYQNTGSAEVPEFTFITDDWLSLSGEGYELRMFPTFGDIDDDGQDEMILGTQDGLLHLYERSGPGIKDFTLSQIELKDHQGLTIDVNSFASPQLFDLNNDGLLDLIIGKRSSGISYYENIGSATSPSFKWVTDDLGQVDMGGSFPPDKYSTPHFVRHNDTLHLFCGNRMGTVYYYNEIEGHIADGDVFNLVSDNYANINTSGYSAPFIDTLRNDRRYEMFVGTDLGGIWAYIAEEFSAPTIGLDQVEVIQQGLKVYPNPSKNGHFTISSEDLEEELSISVFNTVGQSIKNIDQFWGNAHLDLSQSEQGVYILIFRKNSQIVATQRIIKQ